jgi:hypothetical protein
MKILLTICLAISVCGLTLHLQAQTSTQKPAPKEPATMHATGTFDVKITPLSGETESEKVMGRMSIDKQFHGGIEGTSLGQMLSAMTEVKGSGVYVAIERVSGKLNGRSGTFLLHHTGIMDRNVPQLTISVVPDSGTGELEGLQGSLTIKIEGGKHFYDFAYTLPEKSE